MWIRLSWLWDGFTFLFIEQKWKVGSRCSLRHLKEEGFFNQNVINCKNDIFDPTFVPPKLKPQKWDLFTWIYTYFKIYQKFAKYFFEIIENCFARILCYKIYFHRMLNHVNCSVVQRHTSIHPILYLFHFKAISDMSSYTTHDGNTYFYQLRSQTKESIVFSLIFLT